MLSLDSFTTNIILSAAVVALFIIFITLLMKLNPSPQTKENQKKEIEVETQKPFKPIPPVTQNPSPAKIEVPNAAEKPVLVVSPTIGGGSLQTKQEAQAPTLNENKDNLKLERAVVQAKAPVSSKRDCIHHFGYLHTFPKNSPIPDECFGCEKIVDCLVSNSKKSKIKG